MRKAAKNALKTLQNALKMQKIDAFLVPMNDRFQSEMLPAHQQRIQWLTGFTGSAGTLIVLQDGACLAVDSRYQEQAHNQINRAEVTLTALEDREPYHWLLQNSQPGAVLAFDPWLHTLADITYLEKRLVTAGITLQPLTHNPIDALWSDRPSPDEKDAILLDLHISGLSCQEKLGLLVRGLKKKSPYPAFIGDVTASNWLLNIRGHDLEHTPVQFAYTFIHPDERIDVFTNLAQIPDPIRFHLKETVTFHDWSTLETYIKTCHHLYLPAEHTPYALYLMCQKYGCTLEIGIDFYSLLKAKKNLVEAQGIEKCHVCDGLAVTKFLFQLSHPSTYLSLTESGAAALLEQQRQHYADGYLNPSFSTISAVAAHAAMPHYRFSKESDWPLTEETVYLVDSGGQYHTGTTDITRTIYLGSNPSPTLRKTFTLVLKGHIALAAALFPYGTSGLQLDCLARAPLWQNGLDFGHGTGHGIGFRLNVHEGPQSISPRSAPTIALLPGMVVSNEPGYYKAGEYGIRIENVMIVTKSQEKDSFLCFKTLSLAPIDRKLIVADMLSASEKTWLNTYHHRVFTAHSAFLTAEEAAWLKAQTAPL